MVLINDNWEEVRDLVDISKIIREYYNRDLADEMDEMIHERTEEDYEDLISQLKKAASENRLETRIKWFCRYKLLIIDELGYQRMDVDSANLFFNLIAKRYEKLSTIITTNSPFSKWADIFQEPVLTNALLDRLLHHCSVININGPSYRIKDQMQYLTEEN